MESQQVGDSTTSGTRSTARDPSPTALISEALQLKRRGNVTRATEMVLAAFDVDDDRNIVAGGVTTDDPPLLRRTAAVMLLNNPPDTINTGVFEISASAPEPTPTPTLTPTPTPAPAPAPATAQPTASARRHGIAVQRVLNRHEFTFSACRQALAGRLNPLNPARWYDCTAFFDARLEFVGRPDSARGVLISLFLCGLALPQSWVVPLLGQRDVDTLVGAGLLRRVFGPGDALASSTVRAPERRHCCKSHYVATVALFPLPVAADVAHDDPHYHTRHPSRQTPQAATSAPPPPSRPVVVVADFPVESMLPTREAVMPPGYDSLELLVLAQPAHLPPSAAVLDLCCGPGTQGLPFCQPFDGRGGGGGSVGGGGEPENEKLDHACTSLSEGHPTTFVDVNPRALRFTAAALALNGLAGRLVLSDTFNSLGEVGSGRFEVFFV